MTTDFEAAKDQVISDIATAAEAVAPEGSIKGLVQTLSFSYTFDVHYETAIENGLTVYQATIVAGAGAGTTVLTAATLDLVLTAATARALAAFPTFAPATIGFYTQGLFLNAQAASSAGDGTAELISKLFQADWWSDVKSSLGWDDSGNGTPIAGQSYYGDNSAVSSTETFTLDPEYFSSSTSTSGSGGAGNYYGGTAAHDYLVGSAGDDSIDGGTGNDILVGNAGNDLIAGGSGDNSIWGGDGNDYITGATLGYGGAGNDELHSSSTNSQLYGGSGADTLVGGSGSDQLAGGADTDTYVIASTDTGTDTIDDTTGVLKIDSVTIGSNFTGAAEGSLASGFAQQHETLDSWSLGGYTLTKSGNDLLMDKGSQHIVLKNFQEGDFGIHLNASQLTSSDVTSAGVNDLYQAPDYSRLYVNLDNNEHAYFYDSDGADAPWFIAGGTQEREWGTDVSGYDRGYVVKAEDINGTSGNDRVTTAYAFSDTITVSTGAGHDIISAAYDRLEAQNVYAGADRDFITTYSGLGNVYGEDGDDSFEIVGGAGSLTNLYGGQGRDVFVGVGAASIDGGTGIDTWDLTISKLSSFNAATGSVTLTDMGGHTVSFSNIENFVIDGSSGADNLVLGSGDDVVTAQQGNDFIDGGSGRDSLSGSTGNDTIYGGIGNDTLIGGDNDDLLRGGAGGDSIVGGNGSDTVDYTGSSLAVTVNLLAGTATGGDAAGDSISGVENITGSSFNDSLIGDAGNNVLTGGAGHDTLEGGAGADTLVGGDGFNSFAYFSSNAGVTVDLGAGTASGGHAAGDAFSGIANGYGSEYGDSLTGNASTNALYGQGGNDTIDGGDGNDTIRGGDGADSLMGGNGTDTLTYQGAVAGVSVNLGTGASSGGEAAGDTITGFENITGGSFADTLTGDSGNNVLIGNGGTDWLDGDAGNDTLTGNTANDTIYGGDGADLISANSGVDWLSGGAGNDTITGGAGNDIFYFSGSHGADTIMDFQGVGAATGDIIQISGGSFGGLSFSQSGSNAVITHAGGTITLIGVNSASLTVDDFSFAA